MFLGVGASVASPNLVKGRMFTLFPCACGKWQAFSGKERGKLDIFQKHVAFHIFNLLATVFLPLELCMWFLDSIFMFSLWPSTTLFMAVCLSFSIHVQGPWFFGAPRSDGLGLSTAEQKSQAIRPYICREPQLRPEGFLNPE